MMKQVLDYIVQLQSPAKSFVEQRTYFSCMPAAEKCVAYQAMDVVNAEHYFIVSLVNETKGLLNSHVPAADLLGFEFGHVLFVTDEAEQAYDFVQEFRQRLGYIQNIQQHLKQL